MSGRLGHGGLPASPPVADRDRLVIVMREERLARRREVRGAEKFPSFCSQLLCGQIIGFPTSLQGRPQDSCRTIFSPGATRLPIRSVGILALAALRRRESGDVLSM